MQHQLPKGFSLLEKKSSKREKKQSILSKLNSSAGFSQNIIPDDTSKFSNINEPEEGDSRAKRERSKFKKTDRYLEQDAPQRIPRKTKDKEKDRDR